MTIQEIGDMTIPKDANKVLSINKSGKTGDIIQAVLNGYKISNHQLKKFAPYLQGDTLEDTCHNIWRCIKYGIRYQEDKEGYQDVKQPQALWALKVGDCKSFAIFAGSCLTNLGIDFIFRFVSFDKIPIPTHVYVVVPFKGTEIIIDAVLKRFNYQKPYTFKIDYPMTHIRMISGVPARTNNNSKMPRAGNLSVLGDDAHISGLLQNLLLSGERKKVLQAALPSMSILALYEFIPAGANSSPYVTLNQTIQNESGGTNLLQYCPATVIEKRKKSFGNFWNFGAWANIKVETELFPSIKANLANILGMNPYDWWRQQLKKNSIGVGEEVLTNTGGANSSGAISSMFGNVIKNLGGIFGGTNIKFPEDPSIWAPAYNDWTGWNPNPLATLNLTYNTDTGGYTNPPIYTNTGTNTTPVYNPNTNTYVTPGSDNTMLYAGIAAAALGGYFLLKRKKK